MVFVIWFGDGFYGGFGVSSGGFRSTNWRKLCLWIYPLVWNAALMYSGGFCGLKPPKGDHVTFPLILKQVGPTLKRLSPLPRDPKPFSLKYASHPKPNFHDSLTNISPKPISSLISLTLLPSPSPSTSNPLRNLLPLQTSSWPIFLTLRVSLILTGNHVPLKRSFLLLRPTLLMTKRKASLK